MLYLQNCTQSNLICSRATELDIDFFSGRGRGEGKVQIMLDIRLSRGRDNIKNYGKEKNFKKIFGFSCFKASEKRNKGGGGSGQREDGFERMTSWI